MKKIIYNIEHNIEPEINFPLYTSEMISLYQRNSSVRMILNYYTFAEMLFENSKDKNIEIENLNTELNLCIDNILNKNRCSDEVINKLENLRIKNTNYVNILTTYTDIFSLYEHVINRIEYNYMSQDASLKEKALRYENITEEDITRSVMRYILSENDNTIINEKISAVITELPVRMTKSKFYEHLTDAFYLYNNQEKQSLKDFSYMIKSNAVLETEHINGDSFKNLFELYTLFNNSSFENLSKDEFDNLKNALELAVDILNDTVSVHMLFQEILNDLFIIVLGKQYFLNETEEYNNLKTFFNVINNAEEDGFFNNFDDNISDIFTNTEGVQEEIAEKLSKYDALLDDNKSYNEILESLMLKTQFDNLRIMRNLSSGSLFVSLENNTDNDLADEKYIENEVNGLITEFDNSFKNNEKILNRSRISVTLGTLPVFFNNITQMQDYIYDSLCNCRNSSEKTAVKEILLTIININETV